MVKATYGKSAEGGEETLNLRRIVFMVLERWYLFVLFGLAGLAGSYFHCRYSACSYQVDATIFVPRVSEGIEAGFEGLLPGDLIENQSEVFNQMEILRSYHLHQKVVQNLNWRTSWFKKDQLSWKNLQEQRDLFHWTGYYQNEPFQVQETEGERNKSGIALYIEALSAMQYRIMAEGEVSENGERKAFTIDETGTFGKPFTHELFHFILTPNYSQALEPGCRYYFVFNNLSQMAASYRARLSVGLKDKESDLIRLQLSGQQPEREMDYLNELISVYMHNKVSYQTETHKQALSFIEKQLVGISDSLNSAGSSFSHFRASNQVIDISKQGSQVMRMLGNLETEKNRNLLQLDYLRNLLDYLERSKDLKQIISPSAVGIQDISFNRMVITLSELYSQRQVISFSAKDDNPRLVMIDKEIAQTNANLKENLRGLIQNAEVQDQSLAKQQQEIHRQLNVLPRKEQELINYQRHFELTNETYTYLLQRRAELDIALAGATSQVHVIDTARPETIRQVGINQRSKLMMGLLLGLAFPGIFLLGTSFFSTTIDKQEDVENLTALPILGYVSHNNTASDTPVNDHPKSGIAEAYRHIRTSLKFMLPDTDKNIIAIHSIHPGEGKSFNSVNMATILAMNNKRVLLVGCDMRKPRLHKIFNCANDHGLSTYLSKQDTLEEVIMETGIENLSLLNAGPQPPNPSELMNQPMMGELLTMLGSRYDFVILDNAPISHVTDGLLSGRYSHLNLFILRYGISKKEQLKFINQLSENKLLGNVALVINDISGPGFGYGFNYYYSNKYKGYDHGYYEPEIVTVKGIKRIFGKSLKRQNG
ncbi:MAG TPA: polysaccharide biosynthesis tyrosine autokinase [Prolixibacteraceae bacterium]|nr:polysaccharide biosynthesis tyrosine autokinase [Prolixibacteraceae bacterium]